MCEPANTPDLRLKHIFRHGQSKSSKNLSRFLDTRRKMANIIAELESLVSPSAFLSDMWPGQGLKGRTGRVGRSGAGRAAVAGPSGISIINLVPGLPRWPQAHQGVLSAPINTSPAAPQPPRRGKANARGGPKRGEGTNTIKTERRKRR